MLQSSISAHYQHRLFAPKIKVSKSLNPYSIKLEADNGREKFKKNANQRERSMDHGTSTCSDRKNTQYCGYYINGFFFRMQESSCKTFNEAAESVPIYKVMEIDTLMTARFAFGMKAIKREETFTLCRRDGNPNLMFRDGMREFFYLKKEVGKEMLEEASHLGQRDATLVLGMVLMAEGKERKQEAPNLLNDAYHSSGRTWDVLETCTKVERILSRREKI